MKNLFLENGVSNNGWDGKMGIAKSHPPVEICRIYLNSYWTGFIEEIHS